MKIHVSNIKQTPTRIYVEGIRKFNNNGKWESRYVNTSFDPKYFADHVKQLKFPIVFDVKFVKGVGAQFIES